MLPEHLLRVVRLFARLPGVGEKTAQRFGLYLVSDNSGLAAELGSELVGLQHGVQPCELCGNLAERNASGRAICLICADERRSAGELCVVGKVQDLMAIERSGSYRGRYFVLGRLLSPLDGIGPEDLPVDRLIDRIRSTGAEEIILATPPSVDGEATALLLARELGPIGVRLSRIASGVPHGGDLEFADQITLGRALSGRRVMDPSG
ncbi:MAG: recombination protein RecR [Polyangiaceae bacterium]|nr:recombination protein RecR [Polyangiaceae bacterium]